MGKDWDAIFERFEDRMSDLIAIIKIRLAGASRYAFYIGLENFPQMNFYDKKSGVVKAKGMVIADNFSDSLIKGVFTSPYDKAAAKIIPDRFDENLTLIFSGEKLFLHYHDHYDPDQDAIEAPQDFYLIFARAVMNAVEKESKSKKTV